MRLVFAVLLFFLASTFPLLAGENPYPAMKVSPWNGYKGATSLTFDDSDPSHLDVAIPELTARKMRGTFNLIANRTDRKDDWRKMLASGHEVGNHTLDHKHANELTPKDEKAQVVGAQNVLQKEFGVPVLTFAYPFTEVTPGLKKQLEETHLLARGGWGTYVMKPDVEPDWMNIASRATMTDNPVSIYQQWVDEAVQQGGWFVWMVHGLEGTPWGWQPISKATFTQILDHLQKNDIWVGTFLEVGAYFRAQKILEKSGALTSEGSHRSWKVPARFPANVVLKMEVTPPAGGGEFEVLQDAQKISPDDKGLYPILFSKGKMTVRLLPKR
jgi:peptidoglycan/xylan/chitin deacetylase (PgdA/CDA1 family)